MLYNQVEVLFSLSLHIPLSPRLCTQQWTRVLIYVSIERCVDMYVQSHTNSYFLWLFLILTSSSFVAHSPISQAVH